MEGVYVLISGKVQGVFFRRFIFKNAISLDLKGIVRNRDDGRVEAVFQGDNIDKMIELCKKGPKFAKIEKIEVKKFEGKKFMEFRII